MTAGLLCIRQSCPLSVFYLLPQELEHSILADRLFYFATLGFPPQMFNGLAANARLGRLHPVIGVEVVVEDAKSQISCFDERPSL